MNNYKRFIIIIIFVLLCSCTNKRYPIPVDKNGNIKSNYININNVLYKLDNDIDTTQSIVYNNSNTLDVYLPEKVIIFRWKFNKNEVKVIKDERINISQSDLEGPSSYIQHYKFIVNDKTNIIHLKLVNIDDIDKDYNNVDTISELSIILE